ncbi:hypothetical protein HDE_14006 [Halotydeus destructor]|nr:hypothetical protein HDE_14006 [Halotydeus destructor]
MAYDSDDDRRQSNSDAGGDSDVPDGEYVVEDIMKVRWDAEEDCVKYFIKWKGWDRPEDNTWEPEDNLTHCRDLLDQWKQRASILRTEMQKKVKDGKKEQRRLKKEKKRQRKEKKKDKEKKRSVTTLFRRDESSDASSSSSDDEPPVKIKRFDDLKQKYAEYGVELSDESNDAVDKMDTEPINKRPGPKSKTLQSPVKRPGPKSKTIAPPVAKPESKVRPGPKSKTISIESPTKKIKMHTETISEIIDDETREKPVAMEPQKRPGPKSKTVESPAVVKKPDRVVNNDSESDEPTRAKPVLMSRASDNSSALEEPVKKPGPKSKTAATPPVVAKPGPKSKVTPGPKSKTNSIESPTEKINVHPEPIISEIITNGIHEKPVAVEPEKRPGPKSRTVESPAVVKKPDRVASNDSESDEPIKAKPVSISNASDKTLALDESVKKPGPKSKTVAPPVAKPGPKSKVTPGPKSKTDFTEIQAKKVELQPEPIVSEVTTNGTQEKLVAIEPEKRPGPKSRTLESPVVAKKPDRVVNHDSESDEPTKTKPVSMSNASDNSSALDEPVKKPGPKSKTVATPPVVSKPGPKSKVTPGPKSKTLPTPTPSAELDSQTEATTPGVVTNGKHDKPVSGETDKRPGPKSKTLGVSKKAESPLSTPRAGPKSRTKV